MCCFVKIWNLFFVLGFWHFIMIFYKGVGPFLPIVIGTSWIFSFWKPMSWETSAEKFLELFLQWFLPISFWKSCWDFRLPGLILFHFSSFSTLEKSICLFAFLSWRWSQLFHRFLIFSFLCSLIWRSSSPTPHTLLSSSLFLLYFIFITFWAHLHKKEIHSYII